MAYEKFNEFSELMVAPVVTGPGTAVLKFTWLIFSNALPAIATSWVAGYRDQYDGSPLPAGPVAPVGPTGPPAGPVAPTSPFGPVAPEGPVGPPAGPCGPVGPTSAGLLNRA